MPIEFSGFFKQRLQETLETTIIELIKKISTVKPKHLMSYVQAVESLISLLPKEEIVFKVNQKTSKEEPLESIVTVEEDFSEILKALENMVLEVEKITQNEK